MAALTFTLKGDVPERLDLRALTPDRLAGRSAAEIAALVVGTTRARLTVGDVFAVAGDDASDIRFAGGSERFDNVGRGMTGGAVTVDGDVGGWFGAEASGGVLVVTGSARGPYAAAGLSGGSVTIEGDAADCVGGALPGLTAGMTGGAVLVAGRSGDATGDRMRRGTIAVLGGTGADTAARMIGGTILAPRFGPGTGIMMKRGTLVVGEAPELGETFLDSGLYRLPFLALLRRHLAETMPRAASLVPALAHRFRGDTAMLGKGEVLIAA